MKAFPISYKWIDGESDGMDLRDYFAAKAMQSYLTGDYDLYPDEVVERAYKIADAMMKAREQE